MSLVIDFYKNNGDRGKVVLFRRVGPKGWYFQFFKLTIVRLDMDIISDYIKMGKIIREYKKKGAPVRVAVKKRRF